jgi:hypothetical protein
MDAIFNDPIDELLRPWTGDHDIVENNAAVVAYGNVGAAMRMRAGAVKAPEVFVELEGGHGYGWERSPQ